MLETFQEKVYGLHYHLIIRFIKVNVRLIGYEGIHYKIPVYQFCTILLSLLPLMSTSPTDPTYEDRHEISPRLPELSKESSNAGHILVEPHLLARSKHSK